MRAMLLPVAFWVLVLAILRLSVVPPEACGDATSEEMRAAAAEAARWITRNQLDDGRYLYEYNRDTGTPSPDYNIVRHAGVTASLYQAAGKADATDVLEGADRGTEWMVDRLVRHDDWAALADEQSAPLGASALMVVSLAERRLLTGDQQYDEVMRELGRFLVAMQRDNGNFNAYWNVQTREPDLVTVSAFYPGEANWALALLHEAFPDEGFDTAAWAALDYITLHRDEDTGVRMPPRRDHWSAYALGEMAEWGLADHHIDYARGNAARLAATIRWEAQTESWIGQLFVDWRGGEARGAAFGTWVEGLPAIWRLAAVDSRIADARDDIRDRSACGASILVNRQVPPGADPIEAGAWFTEGVTRMDDQQHAISGLIYTADAIDGIARREPVPEFVSGMPIPPPLVEPEGDRRVADRLLAPLLLILVVNPLAAAMFSTGFGGRTSNLRLSRIWWGGGLVLVALVVLLAPPVLDLLRISLPSWQLAAGAIVAVMIAARLVQRDPFTPQLAADAPEWLEVLWGFGWLVSPALIAVIMALTLDLGRLFALVAALLAITLAAIGMLLGPLMLSRFGYRGLRELARWSSLVALIPAFQLVFDGLNGI